MSETPSRRPDRVHGAEQGVLIKLNWDIDGAMLARFNGDLEPARLLVESMQLSFIHGLCIIGNQDWKNQNPRDQAAALCLAASFYRREINLEKSEVLIREAEKIDSSHPQIAMQRGLNCILLSNFGQALTFFQDGLPRETQQIYRLIFEVNIAICCEYLGLSVSALLDRLATAYRHVLHTCPVEHLHDQITAMLMRDYFRQGHYDEIYILAGQLRSEFYQSIFYALWVLHLPYVSKDSYQPTIDRLQVQLSTLTSRGFRTQFDLETIMGMSGTGFASKGRGDLLRPTELIERLYLWTWKSLYRPSAQLFLQILSLHKTISSFGDKISMSKDDFLLLKSAEEILNIMGLTKGWEPCLAQAPIISNQAMTALQDELIFLQRLTQGLQGGHALDVMWMKEHSKSNVSAARAIATWAADDSSFLGEYFQFLQRSAGGHSHPSELVVELSHGRVRLNLESKGSELNSTHAATLLSAIARSGGTLTLNAACFEVYGYHSFDYDKHWSRLSKLLQKINRFIRPMGTLAKRENLLYLTLHRDAKIKILQEPRLQIMVTQTFKSWMRAESSDDPPMQKAEVAVPELVIGSTVTREMIQNFFGIGKTASVGKIQCLVRRGLLRKIGVGRGTRYKILGVLDRD
jgi:hypothetical protein